VNQSNPKIQSRDPKIVYWEKSEIPRIFINTSILTPKEDRLFCVPCNPSWDNPKDYRVCLYIEKSYNLFDLKQRYHIDDKKELTERIFEDAMGVILAGKTVTWELLKQLAIEDMCREAQYPKARSPFRKPSAGRVVKSR